MNKKNTRIIVISVCILVVLIAAFALIYTAVNASKTPASPTDTSAITDTVQAGDTTAPVGQKHLTIKLVFDEGREKTVSIDTDAANLRAALESVDGLIAGEESTYGLFLTTVDGVRADSNLQQWWCITRGGEMLMTGVDDTIISDGETYEITLTTGY